MDFIFTLSFPPYGNSALKREKFQPSFFPKKKKGKRGGEGGGEKCVRNTHTHTKKNVMLFSVILQLQPLAASRSVRSWAGEENKNYTHSEFPNAKKKDYLFSGGGGQIFREKEGGKKRSSNCRISWLLVGKEVFFCCFFCMWQKRTYRTFYSQFTVELCYFFLFFNVPTNIGITTTLVVVSDKVAILGCSKGEFTPLI